MYEELVKSLREAPYDWPDASLHYEAADAIEELCGLCASQSKDCSEAIAKYLELWTKQPRWISVTERLPEKPEGYPKCEIRRTYYLVTLESGCVKTLGYEFDRDEWQITGSSVVAWMDLPEPYKPPKEES